MDHKIWFFLIACLFLCAACAPVEGEPSTPKPEDPNATAPPAGSPLPPLNSYAPAKGDESLTRADVYIDSLEILVQESFPLQYQLQVKGSLPTPCHSLRAVVDEPNKQSEIHVQLYSLVEPDYICTQVLEPFEAVIPIGSYVRGTFTIIVNGSEVGQIIP